MALPLFRAAGAKSAGTTGATTVTAPAGVAVGDLEILVATTIAGGTISISNNGGSAWTAMTPVDVTGGEKLYVWYRVRQTGDGDPQVTPGSDHVNAARLAYVGGTFDSTTPIEGIVTGSEVTSDTSFSFAPGNSSTLNDSLVLAICTSGNDTNTAQFSAAFANANLTALALRAAYQTLNGGGGGFGLTEGARAVAGAVGTWSATLAAASSKAYISFVIRPYVPATFPGTTSVLDDFNRASLGTDWTNPAFGAANSMTITANQLAAAGAGGAACRTVATLPNGQAYYMEFPVAPTGTASLDFACSDATSTVNCYQLQVGTTSILLRRLDAAVATQLGSFAWTAANGDAYGWRIAPGGVIEVWAKTAAGAWTFLGARIDTTYTADGFFGVSFSNITPRGDNLTSSAAATTPVSQTASLPYESLAGVGQATALPYEALQAVAQTAVEPYEALVGLAALGSLPYESLIGVAASRALPLEALTGLAGTGSLPYEALQGVAAARALVWESLAAAGATAVLPLEALATALALASAPYEALQGVAATTTMPWEASAPAGLTAVSQLALLPYEALQGLARLASTPYESLSPAAATASLPYEALAGVGQAATLPLEALLALARFAVLPWEAASLTPVARSAALPYEALQGVRSVASFPWEALPPGILFGEPTAAVVRILATAALARLAPEAGLARLLPDALLEVAPPTAGLIRTMPGGTVQRR